MDQVELKIWHFFNRELAKLNDVLKVYDALFKNINIKNNRYNQLFQLILDSFTRYICFTLGVFFDRRKDSWSLYKFKSLKQARIDDIKNKARPFLQLRHTKFAHRSKNIISSNSFNFLTKMGVREVKNLVKEIENLLLEISGKEKLGESYFLEWGGAKRSLKSFVNDIKR
ncbi:hypothetical protein KKG58_03605 [Patescibacteria group bacterium]|nr:hypothetical protein [Patescibacteria group bacterium]